MYRRAAILVGLGCTALAGGCADIMSQSAISQIAPEWFEAKAVEVKGEGYPDIHDIPKVREGTGTDAEWRADGESLKAAAAKLEAQIAGQRPIPTDEEVRAMAAQLRAKVEGDKADPKAIQP